MTLIVLSEALETMPPSGSLRDRHSSTESARLAGCRIFIIPADFSRCETAENALAHVPDFDNLVPGVWVGYIPDADRYAAIYAAALRHGIRLLNSPDEHADAQEFDRAYPRLADLTPESAVVTSADEAREAARRLGFPVFLKGAIQSRKSRGWRACVAENEEEAERRTAELLSLENRSRGRVIVRRLVRLRHSRNAPGTDFPLGREYRAFVYRSSVLTLAYYWEGDDPLAVLSPAEETTVRSLAEEAAGYPLAGGVGTPYATVDIGQAEDGKWWVIETGDAQFSGLSRTNPLTLWHNLKRAVESND